MRLGQDDEARKQLETCYNNGYKDAATRQLAAPARQLQELRSTSKTGNIILKLHQQRGGAAAALLRSRAEARHRRPTRRSTGFKLDRPVQVEVYPNHEDFAVRTLGMPGLGALGVTFGYVVAMDSPSGRKPGELPLGQHAVARTEPRLHAGRDEAPRAALVHRRHGGARGDGRLAGMGRPAGAGSDPGHQGEEAAAGGASSTAASCIRRIPEQVIVSYFQAGRICDFIDREVGLRRSCWT